MVSILNKSYKLCRVVRSRSKHCSVWRKKQISQGRGSGGIVLPFGELWPKYGSVKKRHRWYTAQLLFFFPSYQRSIILCLIVSLADAKVQRFPRKLVSMLAVHFLNAFPISAAARPPHVVSASACVWATSCSGCMSALEKLFSVPQLCNIMEYLQIMISLFVKYDQFFNLFLLLCNIFLLKKKKCPQRMWALFLDIGVGFFFCIYWSRMQRVGAVFASWSWSGANV